MLGMDLNTGNNFQVHPFVRRDVDELDFKSIKQQPKRPFQIREHTWKIVLFLSFLEMIGPLTFYKVVKKNGKILLLRDKKYQNLIDVLINQPINPCTVPRVDHILAQNLKGCNFLSAASIENDSTYRRQARYSAVVFLPDKQTLECLYKT